MLKEGGDTKPTSCANMLACIAVSYQVDVVTQDAALADTDNDVYISLTGSASQKVVGPVKLPSTKDSFEKGKQDTFVVSDRSCITDAEAGLKVELKGPFGIFDTSSWSLISIKVRAMLSGRKQLTYSLVQPDCGCRKPPSRPAHCCGCG
jgi:hypothetical protein